MSSFFRTVCPSSSSPAAAHTGIVFNVSIEAVEFVLKYPFPQENTLKCVFSLGWPDVITHPTGNSQTSIHNREGSRGLGADNGGKWGPWGNSYFWLLDPNGSEQKRPRIWAKWKKTDIIFKRKNPQKLEKQNKQTMLKSWLSFFGPGMFWSH